MSERYSGGCLCGGVRFEIDGPPGGAGYCHCADCRKLTGSAFNVSAPVAADALRITAGAPKAFTKRADSGNELTRYFCPDCGSPLYTASPAHPDTVYVKAGALDDPTLIIPLHQSWTRSRVSWAAIADDLPGFERSGDDG